MSWQMCNLIFRIVFTWVYIDMKNSSLPMSFMKAVDSAPAGMNITTDISKGRFIIGLIHNEHIVHCSAEIQVWIFILDGFTLAVSLSNSLRQTYIWDNTQTIWRSEVMCIINSWFPVQELEGGRLWSPTCTSGWRWIWGDGPKWLLLPHRDDMAALIGWQHTCWCSATQDTTGDNTDRKTASG